MDFREVWMNSAVVTDENPHILMAKTCTENLKVAETNNMYLLGISIFLLILNVFTFVFFNRQRLLKFYRTRFQPLPHSETASSVFRGAFDHDSFDLKG